MSTGLLTDTERLDLLERCGGFVRGTDAGAPAFRLFGSDRWRPSLREAIDQAQTDRAAAMTIQAAD